MNRKELVCEAAKHHVADGIEVECARGEGRSVPAYCHCELKENGGNVKEREKDEYGDEMGKEGA